MITYITINHTCYQTDTYNQIRHAQDAMREAGEVELQCFAAPYETIEDAENNGFEGEIETAAILFAEED